MADGVSIDALAVEVREHGRRLGEHDEGISDLRAAHDRLRDNVAEGERILRQEHSADMREVRGLVTQGLQAVRDDGQENYRQIDTHLTAQDAKLSRWPPAVTAVVTAVGSLVVYVLVSYFGHLFGW